MPAAGPAVQIERLAIGLRAELGVPDVAYPGDAAAIRRIDLDDDILELPRIVEPALEVERILKVLAFRRGRRADLSGRHFLALLLNDVDDVLRRQSPRLQKVRVQPDAHGVLPGAEHGHVADAGKAAQLVLHIDDRVVRQEQEIEATVGGGQDDELENRRRLLLRRHALELHFLRQRRKRRGHPVLHQDLVLVGIRADREGDGQGVRAVARVRRLHVDHVLDAVDVLLDRQRHGVDESHRARAGIARRHLDGRWNDVRILRAWQVNEGDQADDYDDERQHIGEHRPVDEKARDGSRSAFRAHC